MKCSAKVYFFLKAFLFYFNVFYLFIYFWLCWVFVVARGLSLVAASRAYSSLRCTDFSLQWLPLLWSMGSRCTGFSSCSTQPQYLWLAGSVVVAHRLSCPTACGIFPDQGLNPCPLHWQADSQPLCHQGSPFCNVLDLTLCLAKLCILVLSYL